MNFGYFLFLSTIGTTLWVGLLTYLGHMLGQNYDKVETYMGPISYGVFGFLLIWYIVHIIRHK